MPRGCDTDSVAMRPRPAPGTPRTAPSVKRMLGRGLVRHCPRCGSGHLFRGWFHLVERCPSCGVRYERQPGFSLGSTTVNLGVTMVALLGVMIGGLIATSPDVAVLPVVLISVAVAVVVPIVFYPCAQTVWAAIDLAMHPLEPLEVAEAETYRAAIEERHAQDSQPIDQTASRSRRL